MVDICLAHWFGFQIMHTFAGPKFCLSLTLSSLATQICKDRVRERQTDCLSVSVQIMSSFLTFTGLLSGDVYCCFRFPQSFRFFYSFVLVFYVHFDLYLMFISVVLSFCLKSRMDGWIFPLYFTHIPLYWQRCLQIDVHLQNSSKILNAFLSLCSLLSAY